MEKSTLEKLSGDWIRLKTLRTINRAIGILDRSIFLYYNFN
jgi:hypothetical protein